MGAAIPFLKTFPLVLIPTESPPRLPFHKPLITVQGVMVPIPIMPTLTTTPIIPIPIMPTPMDPFIILIPIGMETTTLGITTGGEYFSPPVGTTITPPFIIPPLLQKRKKGFVLNSLNGVFFIFFPSFCLTEDLNRDKKGG